MNIHIIKHSVDIPEKLILGEYALITEKGKDVFPFVPEEFLYLHNVKKNRRQEILTQYHKVQIGDIFDCEYHSNKIYFHSCEPLGDGSAMIHMHRYDYEMDQVETLYSYKEDFSLFPIHTKMQFFVINDSYLLIQKCNLRSNLSESYVGYLDFEQVLCHTKDGQTVRVSDETFANNGIACMKAISPTEMFLKIGFSLLKDDRYEKLETCEMSVEGLCITNTARLVSDLFLNQNNLVLNMIDQAYQTKTFAYYFLSEPYLIYASLNFETKEETVYFYHLEKKEIICSFINQNVTDRSMLSKPLVLGGQPCMQMEDEMGTDLLELLEPHNNIHIERGESFLGSYGEYLFVEITKRTLFGREKKFVEIRELSEPGTVVHRERGEFAGALEDKDNLLVFLR
ncbi:MAG: hypothetical protein LUE29_12445 [Lachnospiraceae bacterium]|nr:hypothetical protein [Lachnospiraceae bacterium]